MDSTKLCTVVHTKTYKTAQAHPVTIPPTAISAGMIKPLELDLQRKGRLRVPKGGPIAPVWFLAETEKNTYLWKRGLSILDAEDFEFWIDLRELLEKRLAQLDAGDESNPFINRNWIFDDSAPLDISEEISYLESFIYATVDLVSHLSAMSHVAEILDGSNLPIVILPAAKKF